MSGAALWASTACAVAAVVPALAPLREQSIWTRPLMALGAGMLLFEVVHEWHSTFWIISGFLVAVFVDRALQAAGGDFCGKRAVVQNCLVDAVHNLYDGFLLAVAPTASMAAIVVGIILHEIPQEFADVALMRKHGLNTSVVLFGNIAAASTVFVGPIVTRLSPRLVYRVLETHEMHGLIMGTMMHMALFALLAESLRGQSAGSVPPKGAVVFSFALGWAVGYGLHTWWHLH